MRASCRLENKDLLQPGAERLPETGTESSWLSKRPGITGGDWRRVVKHASGTWNLLVKLNPSSFFLSFWSGSSGDALPCQPIEALKRTCGHSHLIWVTGLGTPEWHCRGGQLKLPNEPMVTHSVNLSYWSGNSGVSLRYRPIQALKRTFGHSHPVYRSFWSGNSGVAKPIWGMCNFLTQRDPRDPVLLNIQRHLICLTDIL